MDKGAFETVGPTASNARIAGRVTGNGVGVKGARVTVADANNNARNALTNNFGYYVVEDLEAGQTYVISVSSKRFRFSSQIRSVTESISDLDFVGEE